MSDFKVGDRVLIIRFWHGVGVIERIDKSILNARTIFHISTTRYTGTGGFFAEDFIKLTELTKALV